MEKTKKPILKMFLTFLLSAAVIAGIVYVNLKGDSIAKDGKPYITFACVGVSFLMSLLFIGKVKKKFYLTLALAATVAAHYFLFFSSANVVLLGLTAKNYSLIGICILLGAQFFYLLYSLSLTRAIFLKVLDLALRVALCLLIAFVVRKYITLTTEQLLGLMYLANLLVTVLAALIHIKKEWLTFIGLVLLLVSGVFVMFLNGGVVALKLSPSFLELILKNYLYIVLDTYVAGNLLVSISSVWAKRKSLLKD